MEKLLEILNELNADIDFAHCDTLIDDGPVSYTHLDVYKRQVYPDGRNTECKHL